MVQLSLTLKFILDRGARISAVLTSTHYQTSALVQGSMEIVCKVTVEMFPTLKNTQLLDRLIELVETAHNEPTSSILGSLFADEIEVLSLSNQTPETKSLKTEKIKKMKATKSFNFRDMLRRQKDSDSKWLRVEDEDPYMIIID